MIKTHVLTFVVLMPVLLAGCVAGRSSGPPEVRVSHLPPDEADILEALIRSEGVPLSVHPLCQEIAGTAKDQTIGRYVAGLLATHGPGTENWLGVYTQDTFEDGHWIATFLSISGTEDDPYHWGVEFLIRQSDGLVIPGSFRCFIPWG